MVYLAPGPSAVQSSCSPWGGWHFTLAGAHPYPGDRDAAVDDLRRRVAEAADASARAQGKAWPWLANVRNTAVAHGPRVVIKVSGLVSELLHQLGLRDVGNLRPADGLHMEPVGLDEVGTAYALASMQADRTPFHLYVVERPSGSPRAGAWHVIDYGALGIRHRHHGLEPSDPSEGASASARAYAADAADARGASRAAGVGSGQPTGAGVVLLEMYRRKGVQRRFGVALILFKELATGWFTEAGGKIDAGETPAQAASRELEEESCGLFALDVAHASSERVTVDRGRYSAFFVPVRCEQGIRRDLFASNRAEVESSGCPACWRETTAMTRVYLDDLAAALPRWANGAPLDVRDAYGDAVTVHHRTAAAVNNFLKMGCAGLGRAGVRWNDLAVGRARLSRCDVRNSIIQQYSSYNL